MNWGYETRYGFNANTLNGVIPEIFFRNPLCGHTLDAKNIYAIIIYITAY